MKIANVHETFTRGTFPDAHKMTTSRIHCLVKVLIVVFRNHWFYGYQRMTLGVGVM